MDVSKADYSGEDRSGMVVFASEHDGTGFPVDVRDEHCGRTPTSPDVKILAGDSTPSRRPADWRNAVQFNTIFGRPLGNLEEFKKRAGTCGPGLEK